MNNLYGAHSQWASRPADERYGSVSELHAACVEFHRTAKTSKPAWADLKVIEHDGQVAIMGREGTPALLTHHAFGQVCSRAQAPAQYLRGLPISLAVPALEFGLAKTQKEASEQASENAGLLMRSNGALRAHAVTTDRYARIWNDSLTSRLLDLEQAGWRVPPARPAHAGQPGARPATQADVLRDQGFGLSVKVGDMIAPAGLYASDRDMFAFMVFEKNSIDAGGSDGQMSRGFFLWNSEVGDKSLGLTAFLYQHVCGNHIVWGAKDVRTVKVRHIGRANDKASRWLIEAEAMAEASMAGDVLRIKKAKTLVLGKTDEEVIDLLFGRKILSKVTAKAALEQAGTWSGVHGDPRTAWGVSSGLTRLSQTLPYAEDRVDMDRAAGKVLALSD